MAIGDFLVRLIENYGWVLLIVVLMIVGAFAH
jgi:hypothetical protein